MVPPARVVLESSVPEESVGEVAGAGRGVSRRRWLGVAVAGAVGVAVGGVVASRFVKSPAQAAADTRPPAPDLLTAPVERRVLKQTVVLRGTVTPEQTVKVAPVIGGGDGAAAPVVTKVLAHAGRRVREGQVLLEVSGRPVFVLEGRLPVYRDLKPLGTGEDVAQLQRALRRLGHPTGRDKDGTYGTGTKAAVRALYSALGYDPLPAVDDRGAGIRSARSAVRDAERALQDARDAAAERPAPSPSASGAADSAGADSGAASDPRARRAVTRAEEDLAEARRDLAHKRAAAGPMVPAAEVVFLDAFPARVASVPATVGSQVSGTVMTLSAGRLQVRGSLDEAQKGLVRAGQKVAVLAEATGRQARAKVVSVAKTLSGGPDQPDQGSSGGGSAAGKGGSDDSGGSNGQAAEPEGYAVVVRPDSPLDSTLTGQDVRLTIEAAATHGKVLVVPLTAVSAGADGRTTVTVAGRGGARRRVEVRPGTQGDGFVAVTPVAGGALAPGDQVVTGVRGTGGRK